MSVQRDPVVVDGAWGDPGIRRDDVGGGRDDMGGRDGAGRQDATSSGLVADQVRFAFPPRPGSPSGHQVLDGVSLSVRSGERVGLVGRSGCGKSTLLRILLGLAAPTEGTVHFDGEPIRPGPLRSLRDYRRHVQLIPQDPAASLVPRLTAERNVLVPLVRLQAPEPRLEIARWALQRVGLGEQFWRRRPHELSGGQAQRVAVARALALRPAIVLADEPVSGLDHDLRDQVLDLLHELSLDADALGGGSASDGTGRRLGVLFVSHDPEAVARLCDRTLVLADGRLTESSPLATIERTS
ncbi:MAG: dipeptide/oligopeptide/nickel ABC transporter ATP-binding protein [Micropruina sp.]|uniref:ABC transporter ATP-binding protein n=1 Tax=Micropruina sp. TaxID=2737536 RepID=UPI0039E3F97F